MEIPTNILCLDKRKEKGVGEQLRDIANIVINCSYICHGRRKYYIMDIEYYNIAMENEDPYSQPWKLKEALIPLSWYLYDGKMKAFSLVIGPTDIFIIYVVKEYKVIAGRDAIYSLFNKLPKNTCIPLHSNDISMVIDYNKEYKIWITPRASLAMPHSDDFSDHKLFDLCIRYIYCEQRYSVLTKSTKRCTLFQILQMLESSTVFHNGSKPKTYNVKDILYNEISKETGITPETLKQFDTYRIKPHLITSPNNPTRKPSPTDKINNYYILKYSNPPITHKLN